MTSRPLRSLLASAGLIVGIVVASLLTASLAAEIWMRATHDDASLWRYPNFIAEATRPDPDAGGHDVLQHDAELGYLPRPGAIDTVYGRRIVFSTGGFRIADEMAAPAAGQPILAVGDSFTEGWGLEGGQSWPARLQARTGQAVVNAGVRSYGLDQIVLRTERLLAEVKPSQVVLAFIEQDIDRLGYAVHALRHKPWFAASGDDLALHGVPVPAALHDGPSRLWRRVLGYSYLLDVVMRQAGLFDLWHGVNVPNGVADADLVACRLMRRLGGDLDRAGVPGLVVALPEYREWANPGRHAAARRRNEAVLGCARAAGLRTLDAWDDLVAAGLMLSPEDFNNDGMHLNARGHALVARSIAAAMP